MRDELLETSRNLMQIGQILLGIWITAFGACAGSFLNVVIYRWPAGQSVVNPRSRCPNCLHAVRWFDNIPILNWFWLRGRCRDCGVAIPFRYPAVEILIASIFLTLYLLYVVYLGRNLPTGFYSRSNGEMMHQLIRLLAFHAEFFAIAVAAVLIRYDRHRLPLLLVGTGILGGFAAVSFWPDLHLVPIHRAWKLSYYPGGALSACIGLATGFVLGVINSVVASYLFSDDRQLRRSIFESSLTGLYFGWQAAIMIALMALVGQMGQRATAVFWQFARRIPTAIWVPLSCGVYLLLWRQLTGIWPFLRGV